MGYKCGKWSIRTTVVQWQCVYSGASDIPCQPFHMWTPLELSKLPSASFGSTSQVLFEVLSAAGGNRNLELGFYRPGLFLFVGIYHTTFVIPKWIRTTTYRAWIANAFPSSSVELPLSNCMDYSFPLLTEPNCWTTPNTYNRTLFAFNEFGF